MQYLRGPNADANRLGFSPDGKLLVARHGPNTLRWWDTGTGTEPGPIGIAECWAFDPARNRLLTNGNYWGLHPFDLRTGEEGEAIRLDGRPRAFILRPDGGGLVTCEVTPRRLVGWAWGRGGRPKRRWAKPLRGPIGGPWESPALIGFPDGSRFATVEASDPQRGGRQSPFRLTVRDAASGARVEAVEFPPAYPGPLTVSPDGTVLASLAHSRTIWVWEVKALRKQPREVTHASPKHLTGVAFHPSGQYLAATSNDTTVKLYDTATWQPARTFTWNIGRLRSVAFSPDGTRAAVGSDTGKVVVWDVDL
jgi:WD40 repeat protein